MSGGVDSSVAAALLQEQGHEVVGVTMKLWGGESDSGCCSPAVTESITAAAEAASRSSAASSARRAAASEPMGQ